MPLLSRHPKLRHTLVLGAKLLFVVGAFYFVFQHIGVRDVRRVLAAARPGWLALAAGLFAASKWLSARRLNYFFRAIGVPLSEGENLRLYWLGMYYNLFLPGGIGGDGYKVYLLRQRFPGKTTALVRALLLDRVSGVLALGVLAGVLLAFVPVVPLPWRGLVLAGVPVGVAASYWASGRFFPEFQPLFGRAGWLGLGVQGAQVLCAWAILAGVGTTSHAQASNADVAAHTVIITSLTGHIVEYLVVFLVSSVVAVLPLTVGGIGAREVTFVLGARVLHLDAAVSVTVSLTFYLITAAVALPGAVFSFKGPAAPAP
ncbi:lysylphosphatidylglycerol synthase transmembrane domain-containing protein [Hymenobacter caeli]|uniref:Flippase-like domain-containing protein n=1 Tax=Hymenobacter caeli TaxID=2735894 RepID=A0ABX2FNB9_9BACT|nr:lysylphosphatidylglycerol synthase transmembrane domain-containing protein [Hymenobacter caeli]NRT17930.1 hypothetical protein [Hymenobacter caeli]